MTPRFDGAIRFLEGGDCGSKDLRGRITTTAPDDPSAQMVASDTGAELTRVSSDI